MLILNDVHKTYGDKPVLDGVDIKLKKGGISCLSGPSGTGKSTLIHIAAGIESPDKGQVHRGCTRMGLAFQEPVLLPWKTVKDNMNFVSAGQKIRPRRLLERLGLSGSADLLPCKLSGGMKKRLGLAMAMAAGPDLLFLDEPFAFQDRVWQYRMARYLAQLNKEKGTTLFMASHQLGPVGIMEAKIIHIQETPVRLST